jgi:hypothetical protein
MLPTLGGPAQPAPTETHNSQEIKLIQAGYTGADRRVVYECNFSVDTDIAQPFMQYLRSHMREVRRHGHAGTCSQTGMAHQSASSARACMHAKMRPGMPADVSVTALGPAAKSLAISPISTPHDQPAQAPAHGGARGRARATAPAAAGRVALIHHRDASLTGPPRPLPSRSDRVPGGGRAV